jgi:hypothetical protein
VVDLKEVSIAVRIRISWQIRDEKLLRKRVNMFDAGALLKFLDGLRRRSPTFRRRDAGQ